MAKIDRIAIKTKFNGRCAYCGNKLDFYNFQIDHLVPKALGHFYKSEVMKKTVNATGNSVESFTNKIIPYFSFHYQLFSYPHPAEILVLAIFCGS